MEVALYLVSNTFSLIENDKPDYCTIIVCGMLSFSLLVRIYVMAMVRYFWIENGMWLWMGNLLSLFNILWMAYWTVRKMKVDMRKFFRISLGEFICGAICLVIGSNTVITYLAGMNILIYGLSIGLYLFFVLMK